MKMHNNNPFWLGVGAAAIAGLMSPIFEKNACMWRVKGMDGLTVAMDKTGQAIMGAKQSLQDYTNSIRQQAVEMQNQAGQQDAKPEDITKLEGDISFLRQEIDRLSQAGQNTPQ